jgi:transcriptional regulator with XRE-family HTH domain
MSFGQHLRTLRTAAWLSRADAARRARVPVSTLRGWENDRGFPTLAALVRLAEVYGVSLERFAEGVEDPAEDEPEPTQGKPLRLPKGVPQEPAPKRPRGRSRKGEEGRPRP